MSAYVEIHFDNSTGRFPVEKDEVVIKRAIGLKKDEYFIDRKHANKNEVRRPTSLACRSAFLPTGADCAGQHAPSHVHVHVHVHHGIVGPSCGSGYPLDLLAPSMPHCAFHLF